MAKIKIYCPECNEICLVPVEDYELAEDSQAVGFEFQCDCGCEFVFDLYLDVMNKEKK